MPEKRESGELRRVEGYGGVEAVGDFYWSQQGDVVHFNALLPGNSFRGEKIEGAAFCSIPVATSPTGNQWGWDGNRERPTLTPSVFNHEHWHGFIRAGRFESC